jgi:hypothetical protein
MGEVIQRLRNISEIYIVKEILDYVNNGLDLFYNKKTQRWIVALNPYHYKFIEVKQLYYYDAIVLFVRNTILYHTQLIVDKRQFHCKIKCLGNIISRRRRRPSEVVAIA